MLEILRNLCAESNQTCLAVPAFVLHSCNRMPIEMLPAFLQLPNVYFSFNGRTILNDTMLLHLQHSSLVAEFQDVSLSMPRIPSLDPIPSLLRMESQGSRGLRNGLDTLNTEANLIKAVPLNRLLVETDSPDQLSSMLRNSQTSISMNEPLYVRLSYTAIAKIRDVDVHELCLAVKQNCEKVYKVV